MRAPFPQRISTSSSAIVGWIATVASKSALVSPAFTAIAAACMISCASGLIMWMPTIRSLSSPSAPCWWVARTKAGALVTRLAIAASLMGYSALLIHESHGVIEVHFHIFAALAFLLVYRDWKLPVVAAAVIAVHHLALDTFQDTHHQMIHLLPAGRHGLPIVLLHAVFVVFETVVLVFLSVTLEKEGQGFRISRSALTLRAQVPNLDEAAFARMAGEAEKNCPISKVLNAEITLDAKLI